MADPKTRSDIDNDPAVDREGTPLVYAGVDVGSECVKAVILNEPRQLLGRSVVPATGYFQQRIQEALDSALDEAQVLSLPEARITVTGFGARCAELPGVRLVGEATCHARGAYHHFPEAMTLVDLGARDPTVIYVNAEGQRTESHTLRKCAVGIGTFLMFAARHLDVHPTRLMELAAEADRAVSISSYCSVFGESDLLEQLRDGATREQIALGCMESVAERVLEIGNLNEPVVLTGGVPAYFPGVAAAIEARCGSKVRTVPQPLLSAALGAAIEALEAEARAQEAAEG